MTIEVKMEIFKEACPEVSHGLYTPPYLLSANVSPSEEATKGGMKLLGGINMTQGEARCAPVRAR